MGLVIGEAGSGKTSVLRAFASSLNPSLFKLAYFPLSTVLVYGCQKGFQQIDEDAVRMAASEVGL